LADGEQHPQQVRADEAAAAQNEDRSLQAFDFLCPFDHDLPMGRRPGTERTRLSPLPGASAVAAQGLRPTVLADGKRNTYVVSAQADTGLKATQRRTLVRRLGMEPSANRPRGRNTFRPPGRR